MGQDQHGKLLCIFGQEFGLSNVREPVNQLVGIALDTTVDTPAVEALETVIDRCTQPTVRSTVLGDTVRSPAQHGNEWGFIRDSALLPVAPVTGVTGELARLASDFQILCVSEDEPRGNIALQQNWCYGPVLGTKSRIEACGGITHGGPEQSSRISLRGGVSGASPRRGGNGWDGGVIGKRRGHNDSEVATAVEYR
jgi:hypothetical protein